MISKMKFINIIGPRSEFDRIISDSIMDSAIEFENPLSVLKNTEGFAMDVTPNPYEDTLKHFIDVLQYSKIDYKKIKRKSGGIGHEEIERFINDFDGQLKEIRNKIDTLKAALQHCTDIINVLTPVTETDLHFEELGKLNYLKYRIGKLPLSSYKKLGTYLKDLPSYFYMLTSDKDYVWGIYFVSDSFAERVDRIFSTMYFEPLILDGDECGTPAQITADLTAKKQSLAAELTAARTRLKSTIDVHKSDLIKAYSELKYYCDMYTIRHYASVSQSSFCLTGWIDADEIPDLKNKIEKDSATVLIVEDPETVKHITPPTKLKNLRIFKPFEEFVKMYGVPNYNEIDPTPFLAIVYTLLFGIMFGDVGHGFCLLIAGALMVCMKKGGFLSKLLIPIGISSMIFGAVYGSVFGFEDEHALIRPLWYTPFEGSENMMNTLIYSVVLGVVIILICMIFNVINGIRQKNWQKVLFSQNGAAGMLFYALVLFCAISMLMGSENPLIAALIMIPVSLLLILLQEPLGKLCGKQKNWKPADTGGFLVEAVFELLEIVLSFVTNTVSFLRVGAFALNHAGMMSVVVMFMLKLNAGGSVAVAVFGNLLVIGLEGLIVGIQVLRLGFYEMFSRFYDGNGREFKPTAK